MDEVITLQFDGGSRGNPGPAAAGIVLRAEDGTPLVTLGRFIGQATNNVAEYKGLILAMEEALKLGAKKVVIRGDSQLVIKQMRGEYRVKHPDMRILYDKAQELIRKFDHAKIEHNYRENNELADKLANLAMDRRRDVTEAMDSGRSATRSTTAMPAAASKSEARSASSATEPAGQGVAEGMQFQCPRCGCGIEVQTPSDRAVREQAPFLCVCGVRMKPLSL